LKTTLRQPWEHAIRERRKDIEFRQNGMGVVSFPAWCLVLCGKATDDAGPGHEDLTELALTRMMPGDGQMRTFVRLESQTPVTDMSEAARANSCPVVSGEAWSGYIAIRLGAVHRTFPLHGLQCVQGGFARVLQAGEQALVRRHFILGPQVVVAPWMAERDRRQRSVKAVVCELDIPRSQMVLHPDAVAARSTTSTDSLCCCS
jgi:hypothetical protein